MQLFIILHHFAIDIKSSVCPREMSGGGESVTCFLGAWQGSNKQARPICCFIILVHVAAIKFTLLSRADKNLVMEKMIRG